MEIIKENSSDEFSVEFYSDFSQLKYVFAEITSISEIPDQNVSEPDDETNNSINAKLKILEDEIEIIEETNSKFLEENIDFIDKITDKNNYSIEPRISARYLLNEDWSLKASYAKMQQNIHLLSNSSIGFPSDIWVPSIDSVPSQISEQWAANITTQLDNGKYELSLEGYYKTMRNLITYKSGYSNLTTSEPWQDVVETDGEGESYGLELFVQKKKGQTTGWFGYTLSWSNRRFDNINFGEWYPYKYDRRNDFSIVLSHKFNEQWDVGATWV